MNKEELIKKYGDSETPVNGSIEVTPSEARKLLKIHNNKVENGTVDSFVSLKNINKVYPNGVQAVFDFNLDIEAHDFIVLVGPSGCGKSTTLRMIAGLEDITTGYLYIDKVLSNYLQSKDRDISMVFQSYALYPNMTVYDNIAFPLKIRKVYGPVKEYRVIANKEVICLLKNVSSEELAKSIKDSKDRMVNFGKPFEYFSTKYDISDKASKKFLSLKFTDQNDIETRREEVVSKLEQEIEAYKAEIEKKHMSLNEENELLDAQGEIIKKRHRMTKEEIRRKVFNAARILDLGPYLDRRPKELSGGQMQRVALGRAIVRNAKLFLMDEPLSNLDAKLRVQMRSEIVALHEKIGATSIYVTHDQTEAMTMATKIVVMSKGWVQQIGTPQEVYHNPKNIFVATFIGSPAMNIFDGTYDNGKVIFKDGYTVDLGKEFVDKHNKFFEFKVKDTERILSVINDKSYENALAYLNEKIVPNTNNPQAVKEALPGLREILEGSLQEEKDNLIAGVDEISALIEKGDKVKYTNGIRHLVRLLGKPNRLNERDIASLHSAMVFGVFNENKEKEANVISYGKNGKKVANKRRKSHKPQTYDLNELRELAEKLLVAFQAALQGPHDIKIGIRPEHIHLDNEFNSPNKTEAFDVKTGIVELMGTELLLHAEWNETDMIAKISTGTLVKPHEDIKLSLDKSLIKVFDNNSCETIE